MSYDMAKVSMQQSLELMGLEYLDLVLIHWPTSILEQPGPENRLNVWKAMEEFKEQGLVKSIGVSNFLVKHLEPFLAKIKHKPVVNEIETHPLFQEEATIKLCQENGIRVISYAPLATFDDKLMKSEVVLKLCEKYGKKPQ